MTNSPVAALFETDAYKLDHRRQYGLAGKVDRVYSNYTNRKSRIPGFDHVVHFGLQAYLHKLTESFKPFFEASRSDVERLYRERVAAILGPDAAEAIGTEHIGALHDLGYLPLRFCAVPEGTLVPIRVPSFTVENTHDDFFWLTNYLETGISAAVWGPSTSATIAHAFRVKLENFAFWQGLDESYVDFQLHDFSFRGMNSWESAHSSGAAHLLSFKGSDSLSAWDFIEKYYGGLFDLMSVPATEHSVMSTGIMSQIGSRTFNEEVVFEKLLDLYPTGILSVVSDTFDLWNVLETVLPALKDKVLARDGKLVIRPDSGDPEKILCGNPAGRTVAEQRGVVELLWETFGGSYNANGYRELDPHIGTIYGDSITLDRADAILQNLQRKGFAANNVVFGVGSYTYQYNTRDTFGSAMKATWARVDGKGVNLFKDPVTDDGTKRSATGRLAVLGGDGEDLYLVEQADPETEARSLLQPVWQDGWFIQHQSFAEVREVLRKHREALHE
ncbi:nicotinate ribosyltransferase [Mycobacterium phage ScoobyDoobyDoo]|nr:nicotinate ribosyltransferase [Mycobacterium phage ScoobyDoobyDoo]